MFAVGGNWREAKEPEPEMSILLTKLNWICNECGIAASDWSLTTPIGGNVWPPPTTMKIKCSCGERTLEGVRLYG